ncbi:MAG: DUF4169 family protein [Tabrizicola sp.]|nr:DUF4169 family protein [Tabrizicola sp.]
MTEIVNLRQARKEAARQAARATADANAVQFGRTKAERELAKAQAAKAARDHDAHKRETD